MVSLHNCTLQVYYYGNLPQQIPTIEILERGGETVDHIVNVCADQNEVLVGAFPH